MEVEGKRKDVDGSRRVLLKEAPNVNHNTAGVDISRHGPRGSLSLILGGRYRGVPNPTFPGVRNSPPTTQPPPSTFRPRCVCPLFYEAVSSADIATFQPLALPNAKVNAQIQARPEAWPPPACPICLERSSSILYLVSARQASEGELAPGS